MSLKAVSRIIAAVRPPGGETPQEATTHDPWTHGLDRMHRGRDDRPPHQRRALGCGLPRADGFHPLHRHPGRHRTSWGRAGFAVFGRAQILICQPHSAPTISPPSLSLGIAYRLLPYVNTAADSPYPSMQFQGYPAISSDHNGRPYFTYMSGVSRGSGWVPVNGLRSGLCLSSLVVGFVGAFVGGFIARRPVPRRDALVAGTQFRREVVS